MLSQDLPAPNSGLYREELDINRLHQAYQTWCETTGHHELWAYTEASDEQPVPDLDILNWKLVCLGQDGREKPCLVKDSDPEVTLTMGGDDVFHPCGWPKSIWSSGCALYPIDYSGENGVIEIIGRCDLAYLEETFDRAGLSEMGTYFATR